MLQGVNIVVDREGSITERMHVKIVNKAKLVNAPKGLNQALGGSR